MKKLEDENENLKMDGNMNAGRTIGGEGLSNDVIDEITK